MSGFTAIRKSEARIFFEGKEMCREYCSTGKITFGTSQLPPGEEGTVDPGHAEAHEVFFVVRGTVVITNEKGVWVELAEGDALLVTEGIPHRLINVSEETAVVSWSCAPKP